jgi:hypothetical protein
MTTSNDTNAMREKIIELSKAEHAFFKSAPLKTTKPVWIGGVAFDEKNPDFPVKGFYATYRPDTDKVKVKQSKNREDARRLESADMRPILMPHFLAEAERKYNSTRDYFAQLSERKQRERAEREAWRSTPEGMAATAKREAREKAERSEAAARAADTRRRRMDAKFNEAASALLAGVKPEGKKAGHCFCCGKALTDQKSQELGIGPECLQEAKQRLSHALGLMDETIPPDFKITPGAPLMVPKGSSGVYVVTIIAESPMLASGFHVSTQAVRSIGYDKEGAVLIQRGGATYVYRHKLAVYRGAGHPGMSKAASWEEAVALGADPLLIIGR